MNAIAIAIAIAISIAIAIAIAIAIWRVVEILTFAHSIFLFSTLYDEYNIFIMPLP